MTTLRLQTSGAPSVRPTETAATGVPGHGRVVLAALASPRRVAAGLVGTVVYVGFLSYVTGMLARPGDAAQGWFEVVSPVGDLPYVALHFSEGWVLSVNVIQAVHLTLIVPLAFVLAVLFTYLWSSARRQFVTGPAAAISGVLPAALSGGACAACAAAPAGFLFIPASVASGFLGFLAIAHFQTLIVPPILSVMLYMAVERARRVPLGRPDVLVKGDD